MKRSILGNFTSLKQWIFNGFSIKKSLIACFIVFLSFSTVFSSGALSTKTINEECAEYFADVAKTHTNCNGDKKLSGLVVEPKEGTGSRMRIDTDAAITELWGVFKGNNASFAPTINANRKDDIHFIDYSFSDENLSLVYTEDGLSSIPYHINKNTKEIIDYKFQSSPIALMFPSNRSGMQSKLPIYISQTQAERKLKSKGIENITIEDLQSLQNTETKLIINNKIFDCVVDNIYLDNANHEYRFSNYDYYYASDVGTVLGDFVFAIFTHYEHKNEISIERQSLYIMSEYSFRNKFYLEYAINSYSPDNYLFDYARYNIKDGFLLDNTILQRAIYNTSSDVFAVLLTILTIVFFVIACFFVYRYRLFIQPMSLLLIILFSFVPYFVFKFIYMLNGSILVFSSYSLILYLILLVIFYLFVLLLNFFGRKLVMENKNA